MKNYRALRANSFFILTGFTGFLGYFIFCFLSFLMKLQKNNQPAPERLVVTLSYVYWECYEHLSGLFGLFLENLQELQMVLHCFFGSTLKQVQQS